MLMWVDKYDEVYDWVWWYDCLIYLVIGVIQVIDISYIKLVVEMVVDKLKFFVVYSVEQILVLGVLFVFIDQVMVFIDEVGFN